jgi:hypothetical protein
MRRLAIHSRRQTLGIRVLEAVSPPVFGRNALISTDVNTHGHTFALRRGMTHVIPRAPDRADLHARAERLHCV